MNCSCVYVDLSNAEFGNVRGRRTEETQAVYLLTCCECKRTIEAGETYRKEVTEMDNWRKITQITCLDCISIRDTFFCDGWYYEMIFEYLREHIRELDGEISEDCIVALTPKAQEKVCKIIEDCWKWNEE